MTAPALQSRHLRADDPAGAIAALAELAAEAERRDAERGYKVGTRSTLPVLRVLVDPDLQLEPVVWPSLIQFAATNPAELNIELVLLHEPSMLAARSNDPDLWLAGLHVDLQVAVQYGRITLDPPWPGTPIDEFAGYRAS